MLPAIAGGFMAAVDAAADTRGTRRMKLKHLGLEHKNSENDPVSMKFS
jgi:hypothetical protein